MPAPSRAVPADAAALRHARRLLARHPVIDGHNDLPWTIRNDPKARGNPAAYDLRRPTRGDTDLARLKAGGFKLCDTQFVTEHLKSFGAIEVPKPQYHKLLEAALSGEADFTALDTERPVTGAEALALLDTPARERA